MCRSCRRGKDCFFEECTRCRKTGVRFLRCSNSECVGEATVWCNAALCGSCMPTCDLCDNADCGRHGARCMDKCRLCKSYICGFCTCFCDTCRGAYCQQHMGYIPGTNGNICFRCARVQSYTPCHSQE